MSINKFILLVWFFLLSIVTGFLIAEYSSFKKKVEQLDELKEEYAVIVDEFRKLVEYSKESSDAEDLNNKKKKSPKSDEKFLIVNREPKYLKKSALIFAKKYNVENELQRMYGVDKDIAITKKRKLGSKVRNKLAEYALATKRRKINREAIFVWPIKRGLFRLSSFFGPRKKPRGSWEFHSGIDMAASTGTPIHAAADGIVIESGYLKGYGNTIRISHNQRFKTKYAHLSVIGVKVGQRVRQYEEIGKVGATGNVRSSWRGGDASHLHFEVHDFDRPVNPFYFLG